MTTSTEKYQHKHFSEALEAMDEGEAIRFTLPDGGFLFMDRPLPYVCVYRLPGEGLDHLRFKLEGTEASYLVIPGAFTEMHRELLLEIATTLSGKFGAFLLLEIWTANVDDFSFNEPRVRIIGPADQMPGTVEGLKEALEEISFSIGPMQVEVEDSHYRHPPGMLPLLEKDDLKPHGILLLGLEIYPFFMNAETRTPYPVYLRTFRRQLGLALKKAFFNFIRLQTTHEVIHFHTLGTTRIDEKVWKIDREIVSIANQFRFLWLVTPINTQEAWEQFQQDRFLKDPVFHYRMMPVDPENVKRDLYNIQIEEVEDPTLAYFFRDKREELVKMLQMLADRGTPDFMYSSLQVFGGVSEQLYDIAAGLLTAIPADQKKNTGEWVDAKSFYSRAMDELEYLRRQYPDMKAGVEIRNDVSGIMVSQGTLYISEDYHIRKERVEALIQHEVGTHVLTYWNGQAQRLQQLYSGVPGYESLQEGLAVLAEFLVGGLTNARLRLLAARVVGVRMLINGASFRETFSQLVNKFQFSTRQAFHITTRVYRSGGLTKDAVYLRGLIELLDYLKEGNDLEALLIGKIRPDYMPLIRELTARHILVKPPMLPRYLRDPVDGVQERLSLLQAGANIFSLINYS